MGCGKFRTSSNGIFYVSMSSQSDFMSGKMLWMMTQGTMLILKRGPKWVFLKILFQHYIPGGTWHMFWKTHFTSGLWLWQHSLWRISHLYYWSHLDGKQRCSRLNIMVSCIFVSRNNRSFNNVTQYVIALALSLQIVKILTSYLIDHEETVS